MCVHHYGQFLVPLAYLSYGTLSVGPTCRLSFVFVILSVTCVLWNQMNDWMIELFCTTVSCLCKTYAVVILQGNMFAVTLYDAVYQYLKLASGVVNEVGPLKAQALVTNGTYMYDRARHHYSPSREYCHTVEHDVPLYANTLCIFYSSLTNLLTNLLRPTLIVFHPSIASSKQYTTKNYNLIRLWTDFWNSFTGTLRLGSKFKKITRKPSHSYSTLRNINWVIDSNIS